jgi:4-hydroxy-tetrahydrodipicolinate synthase
VALDIVNLDSVVACKYEVGGIAGHYDFWKRIKDSKVLYSDPMEQHFPISVELFGQQWSGTSGYELYGDVSPRIFKLLRQGEHEEAMKLHWQIEPARQMRATLTAQAAGANFIHRYLWKYWAWLHGYNGGPLRQPTNRLNDNQMRTSRDAVSRSGFKVRDEAFADFFVGRNPA